MKELIEYIIKDWNTISTILIIVLFKAVIEQDLEIKELENNRR